MLYADNAETLKKWFPLIMEKRSRNEAVAATRMNLGTYVNFGVLTRLLIEHLVSLKGVTLKLSHEVSDIEKSKSGNWNIEVKNLETHEKSTHKAPFVFIGAGGGALSLLEKTNIPESEGYGGFPVSGQWLICRNEAIVKQHDAKVYGKAGVGAPPMSVPHLDTRIIDGKHALLFGPYAGFSTKFLKHGSLMDLPASLQLDNILPMVSAGIRNLPLTKYLIEQVMQSPEDRLAELKKFVPTAVMNDWKLEEAGQRVQVIKKDKKEGGILEFGTEVVAAADGSIAALLGASPGASTSVSIMLELLTKCFKEKLQTAEWQNKLQEMIPSYGKSLAKNKELAQSVRAKTSQVLKLQA
ncbi:MAG TPA: malate:quinone oxidoreductase, partial [Chitinophagales bacterium]